MTALLMLGAAWPAFSCSAVMCLGNGTEFNRSFVVAIKHFKRPVPKVTVRLTRFVDGDEAAVYTAMTGADGTVRMTDLPAGDYWMDADLLGISAANQCFHIRKRPSLRAKRKLSYHWSEPPRLVRTPSGILASSEPGSGGTTLWNLTHRVRVPIVGARLKLQNPFNHDTFHATSDTRGMFSFGSVPMGTYVLHAEVATKERVYDETLLAIQLTPTARGHSLSLTYQEAGAGSCGNLSLTVTDLNQ